MNPPSYFSEKSQNPPPYWSAPQYYMFPTHPPSGDNSQGPQFFSQPPPLTNPNALECLQRFVKGICEIFREARGFPGMLGTAPTVQYTVNRTQYNMGYYLADDKYPDFAIFVKTISMPQGEKGNYLPAFGVLQSRFTIIRGLTHFWDAAIIKNIIYACIILHNMIVEDE
uniref:Uncharacterized protein n=1 Tax=Cajanus cajan TaxID=3821 RepID=A0A151S9F2_CAJCA|nr:hypothetical protein KK1_026802 [Cajanus cajan]